MQTQAQVFASPVPKQKLSAWRGAKRPSSSSSISTARIYDVYSLSLFLSPVAAAAASRRCCSIPATHAISSNRTRSSSQLQTHLGYPVLPNRMRCSCERESPPRTKEPSRYALQHIASQVSAVPTTFRNGFRHLAESAAWSGTNIVPARLLPQAYLQPCLVSTTFLLCAFAQHHLSIIFS